MTELARFFGITIAILAREHNPPHIHAEYGKFKLTVEIKTLRCKGKFPKTGKALVLEWAKMHQPELLKMWETKKFKRIKPLDKD